jgi:Arc/MetJ-type ribon-helix-helix transcriptional regulator
VSDMTDRIRKNIDAGAYEQAYSIGRDALQKSECSREEIIAVLRELTARLRAECMGLAVKKMDSGAAYDELEALLRESNKLTGQDMYGH